MQVPFTLASSAEKAGEDQEATVERGFPLPHETLPPTLSGW